MSAVICPHCGAKAAVPGTNCAQCGRLPESASAVTVATLTPAPQTAAPKASHPSAAGSDETHLAHPSGTPPAAPRERSDTLHPDPARDQQTHAASTREPRLALRSL